MGAAYKNFWSINTDEAVVIGLLRQAIPKHYEMFLPANAQMKDVDLVLINMKNKKAATIQVKGSRAFEPTKKELAINGAGSAGWFYFGADVVHKSTADYFVFLVYVLEENKIAGRRNITPHVVVIDTKTLSELSIKNKKVGKGNRYNYYIWINPETQKAFEFRDQKYSLDDYLNKNGIGTLVRSLK